MSLKKAQKIQRTIDDATGIDIASFQTSDLHFLKEKLEEFLDLNIDTDDLTLVDEPSDDGFFLDEAEETEEEDYA